MTTLAPMPARATRWDSIAFPNDITAYVQMGDEAPQLLGREDSWMRLQLRVWGTEGRGQVDLPIGTRVWRKGETEPSQLAGMLDRSGRTSTALKLGSPSQ